jgi:hypothetical protein
MIEVVSDRIGCANQGELTREWLLIPPSCPRRTERGEGGSCRLRALKKNEVQHFHSSKCNTKNWQDAMSIGYQTWLVPGGKNYSIEISYKIALATDCSHAFKSLKVGSKWSSHLGRKTM